MTMTMTMTTANTVFCNLPVDVIHIIDQYGSYQLCCGRFTHDVKIWGNRRGPNGRINFSLSSRSTISEHVIVEIVSEEVLVYVDGFLTSKFVVKDMGYPKPHLFQNEIYIMKPNQHIEVFDIAGALKRKISLQKYSGCHFHYLRTKDGHFICSPATPEDLIFIFSSSGEFIKRFRTGLKNQRLLHVSHQTGKIYVSNEWQTCEFDSTGTFIRRINFPRRVNNLCTIGFMGEFVVNIRNSVDLYDADGWFLRNICQTNTNSVSNLFVTDTGQLMISLPDEQKVSFYK